METDYLRPDAYIPDRIRMGSALLVLKQKGGQASVGEIFDDLPLPIRESLASEYHDPKGPEWQREALDPLMHGCTEEPRPGFFILNESGDRLLQTILDEHSSALTKNMGHAAIMRT